MRDRERFEHGRKKYVRVESSFCDECAFGGGYLGCCAPEGTPPCDEDGTPYIWKEASDG